MDKFRNNLTKHLDVFREIGNIGAGNAASALGDLLDRKIRMTVPDADIVPSSEIFRMFSGPESLVAGVLIEMTGDLHGFILLVLDMDEAMSMVNTALNEPVEAFDATDFELSDREEDALLEIANIIVGSFISAISKFTGLDIRPSVPHVTVDMLASIVTIATTEYLQVGDDVLLMRTRFSDSAGESSGRFVLIPDYSSYTMLINSLGLEG